MDNFNFDDFIVYYDQEDIEEEQDMDDQYEEEMLAKNKNNKDYNHNTNTIPSDPPASPHNNKHLGLSKSVDDSLDIL